MEAVFEPRSHERKQLLEFLPDLGVESDLIESIRAEDYEEIEYDDWVDITIELLDLEDSRSQWLRTKIARRTRQPTVRSGFTTMLPQGVVFSGKEPDEVRE